jgi:hypothetical protein
VGENGEVIDLQAVLSGQHGRLFVPLVYRLAARLEQVEWEEFADDPPTAAFALRGAQHLFGLRALVSHYRLGAEAEACGVNLTRDAHGDWPFPIASQALEKISVSADAVRQPPLDGLIDLTRRLASELHGQAAVIAVLSGPRTLAALLGTSVGLDDLYAALARAYAEAGARALLIAEDPRAPVESAVTNVELANLGPLLNVARYFRLPAIVLAEHQGRLPNGWLPDPPEAHTMVSDASLLFTDGEVQPELPAERLQAWCDALA